MIFLITHIDTQWAKNYMQQAFTRESLRHAKTAHTPHTFAHIMQILHIVTFLQTCVDKCKEILYTVLPHRKTRGKT